MDQWMSSERAQVCCTNDLNLRSQTQWAEIDSKTVLYNAKVLSFVISYCSAHYTRTDSNFMILVSTDESCSVRAYNVAISIKHLTFHTGTLYCIVHVPSTKWFTVTIPVVQFRIFAQLQPFHLFVNCGATNWDLRLSYALNCTEVQLRLLLTHVHIVHYWHSLLLQTCVYAQVLEYIREHSEAEVRVEGWLQSYLFFEKFRTEVRSRDLMRCRSLVYSYVNWHKQYLSLFGSDPLAVPILWPDIHRGDGSDQTRVLGVEREPTARSAHRRAHSTWRLSRGHESHRSPRAAARLLPRGLAAGDAPVRSWSQSMFFAHYYYSFPDSSDSSKPLSSHQTMGLNFFV